MYSMITYNMHNMQIVDNICIINLFRNEQKAVAMGGSIFPQCAFQLFI